MKNFGLKFLVVFLASVTILSGCKDDSEETVSDFVGNYVISSASVSESFSIKILYGGQEVPFSVPEGTPITEAIQSALLSQVDCSSADKSWVGLRKDNKIILSCEGENELDAGTWEEVSETELKLNMNSSAIPSAPAGISLVVTDVSFVGSGLKGETSVPLPKATIETMLSGLGVTLSENNPETFTVSFSISFIKQ